VYKLPFDEEDRTATFLFKTYRTFKQTMIEANIWAALHKVGFEFDTSRDPYRLRFNQEKTRRSPGFQEIWVLGFPFEKLSTRLQEARPGWINQSDSMRMIAFISDLIE
jgi:hypothetical protein